MNYFNKEKIIKNIDDDIAELKSKKLEIQSKLHEYEDIKREYSNILNKISGLNQIKNTIINVSNNIDESSGLLFESKEDIEKLTQSTDPWETLNG